MSYLWTVFLTLPPSSCALVALSLATIGWLYSARRARALSRKQHTFNALLQLSSNLQYHSKIDIVRPYVIKKEFPAPIPNDADMQTAREAFRYLLNHYEFLAAGIRNGDISERLLRDSERGTIIALFEVSHKYIAGQRDALRRSTYEHIEWLYIRWKEAPPSNWQRALEWFIARPLYHDRQKWIGLAVLIGFCAFMVIGYLHLPGEIFNPLPANGAGNSQKGSLAPKPAP